MRIRTNTRTARAAAALAAAGAALAAAAVPAHAAPAGPGAAPAFLEAGELPPHASSPWTAHPVTAGLPEAVPFCVAGQLPRKGSSHRLFTTELETNATQVVVETATPRRAARLAAALEEAVRGCADRVEAGYPEATASWKDLGGVDAGDGAHVYGVETAFPESARDVHLYGVGRDGDTVTLVDWGEFGTVNTSPVADFRETTATAVTKLHAS
ncbi:MULTISPECIES: hypothetical protein [Streptomyces]|uniref:PknH-like extracellular domain-containing protein n=1 Tax=Streptomyces lycii TaxID=2654337 RepID=A0ABQ7FCH6_9ACTN|nr:MULTISPECIES: hypothetical protein [Streptomyces]KAF4406345.1 hypothetical protein GCU69_25545 [Streptomyces lycii]PGH47678.1 hypothetical protein CRI70_27220 [Streptomyces sp. Ru87]